MYGGILTKNFSKDSRMTIMLMTAGVTLICEIISYIMQIIVFDLSVDIIFLKIVLMETLYNTMLVIILYPIIKRAGARLEKIFTEQKILTRYY